MNLTKTVGIKLALFLASLPPNKPSQRDNYMQAPVTSFRILACMYLPLLGALGVKLHRVAQYATLIP